MSHFLTITKLRQRQSRLLLMVGALVALNVIALVLAGVVATSGVAPGSNIVRIFVIISLVTLLSDLSLLIVLSITEEKLSRRVASATLAVLLANIGLFMSDRFSSDIADAWKNTPEIVKGVIDQNSGT